MERFITPTLEPGRLFLVSRLIVVSDVVKVAVNIEQMQIPIRIQHTAKVLPNREMGARSPYPTVVMETNAHQNPSHEPLKKLRGNCSSLNQVSSTHKRTPAKIERRIVNINTGHASNTDIKSFFGKLSLLPLGTTNPILEGGIRLIRLWSRLTASCLSTMTG